MLNLPPKSSMISDWYAERHEMLERLLIVGRKLIGRWVRRQLARWTWLIVRPTAC
jgi:hypothetical protein